VVIFYLFCLFYLNVCEIRMVVKFGVEAVMVWWMTWRVMGWPDPCFTGRSGRKHAHGPGLRPSMQPVGQHSTVESSAGPTWHEVDWAMPGPCQDRAGRPE
jgi:hypothetical protein